MVNRFELRLIFKIQDYILIDLIQFRFIFNHKKILILKKQEEI